MSTYANTKSIWTGTLKAYSGQANYLKVDDSGMLVATGTSEHDPACSFTIYRTASGEILQSNLNGHYAGLTGDQTNGYFIKIGEEFDAKPLLFGLLLNGPDASSTIFVNSDPRYYPGQQSSWQYLAAFAQYKIGVKPAVSESDPNQIFDMDPSLPSSFK